MKEQLISFETAKLAKEKGWIYPTLNFEDENGNEPNELELLGSLTPSRGHTVRNPIHEIEELVRVADAEMRQEIADGSYFSSCD